MQQGERRKRDDYHHNERAVNPEEFAQEWMEIG